MESRKWSWTEFVLGWINKQFLIWCVSTALIFIALFTTKVVNERLQFTLIVVWGIVSFCLFFYKAITKLIENGKLSIDAKATIGSDKK